jgi:electron transfer flavoprotein alpha/beta subunit
MLKIVVCVKAVPDSKLACNLKIDPVSKTLLRCDVPMVLNPLDKHALEAALQIKAETGAHICALSMGPPEAGSIVKECMALGADEGILLCDPCFGGADAYATAYTLVKGVQKIGDVDAVLCGMASSDGATEWVGPEMAIMLDIPVVTRVKEISMCDGESWEVKAALENGYRRMRVRLPALLTVTRDLNTPRALSFSGIIKARKKVITPWGLDDLGAPAETVGIKGSPTIVTEMCAVENTRRVTFLEGTREEKAELLLQKLIERGVL